MMSEQKHWRLSWVMVLMVVASGMSLLYADGKLSASGDHDQVQAWRQAGDVLPLAELLQRPELQGQRILEAELEREHGRVVYELEVLGADGRVSKQYFDATTGEPLARRGDH